jgi:hypothetical protein
MALLKICVDPIQKSEVQLNAAIQLKNYIVNYWKFGENTEINKSLLFDCEDEVLIISNDNKEAIRTNILQALLHTNTHLVIKQLNQSVKKILKYDFKDKWTSFTQTVLGFFNTGDDKNIYTGIIAFHQLSKIYEFETGDYKKAYNASFDAIQPYLISFLDKLLGNLQNDQAALICYKIIKIFFKSIQLEVSQSIMKSETFDTWMTTLVKIMKSETITHDKVDNQEQKDKLAALIQWKLVILAYQTSYRVYQKYGYLSALESKKDHIMKEFCLTIQNRYSELFLNIYLEGLNKSKEKYIPDKVLFYIFKYMSQCVSRKINMKIIEANLDTIIREYIIQNSFISVKEIAMFEDDAKTYINRQFDITEHYYILRYTICQFIKSICDFRDKDKKSVYFEYIYKYFVSILEIYESQIIQGLTVDSRIKEAVLYILQAIASDIIKYIEIN